jgi:hypothetical protein
VPAGDWSLELRYEPSALRRGVWLSVVGFLVLAWSWLKKLEKLA